jgi:succinate dehydrogenase/fumarate reductase cytochrome b subunit
LRYWSGWLQQRQAQRRSALSCFAAPDQVAMFAWLLARYHLLNGLRHLGGLGYALRGRRKTGTVVFIGAIVLTVLT